MRPSDNLTVPEIGLQCVQPPVISENLADFQSYAASILGQVTALPKTIEHLSTVKALRSQLRKQFESLEDQRKAVKKAVTEPYARAEQVYKERISGPMQSADAFLKAWVDTVQDEHKNACREKLKIYFDELCQALGIDFVRFEDCGITVDMTMASQKELRKAYDTIHTFLNRISDDLTTISTMEYAQEILAEYKHCLSVSGAIRAVNQHHADVAAAAKALEDTRTMMGQQEQQRRTFAEAVPLEPQPQEKKFTVTFTVTDTTPRLRGLKAFLDGHKYTYKED